MERISDQQCSHLAVISILDSFEPYIAVLDGKCGKLADICLLYAIHWAKSRWKSYSWFIPFKMFLKCASQNLKHDGPYLIGHRINDNWNLERLELCQMNFVGQTAHFYEPFVNRSILQSDVPKIEGLHHVDSHWNQVRLTSLMRTTKWG